MSPQSGRGFAFGAVLLATAAFLFLTAKSLDAVVSGTPHDFSTKASIAPSGACSACHIPHGSDSNAPLWSRNLSLYVSRLTMNGDASGKPNYIASPTLACYDCHDDHASIDDVPANSAFSGGGIYPPPDIAFGGAKAGFYEHSPPNPAGGSYGVFSYPSQFTPATPDNLAKSGGHYFKQDPTGSTAARPDVGDKLSCRDCHDPHSGPGFQAFIRTDLPNSGASPGLGASYTSVTASGLMSNNTGRTRSNAESRKICVACHAYSNNGTPVKFNQIRSTYTNSTDSVPRPPAVESNHDSSATAACVSCHSHNSVRPACDACHGYPSGPGSVPGYPAANTPSAYPASNDSHARHVGRQSGAPANSTSVYSLQCGVCHFNNDHQSDNVDIVFNLPSPMPQPSPNGFAAIVPPGGSSCANVYCHSAGHDNLAVSDFRNVTWGSGSLGCNRCHGNLAYDNTNIRYGMPDYANGGVGTPTANSHTKHVAEKGYACNVCHAGTASATRTILGTIPTLHANGARNVVFGGIATGVGATPYNGVTKTCSVSCHGNAGGATLPRWGGAPMAGCGVCHVNQGAATVPPGVFTQNELHHPHSEGINVKIACETCHANRAADNNAVHVGGPENQAAGQTANIRYTDNASAQTYDGRVLLSRNLRTNPFNGVATTPAYVAGAPGATDTLNSTISYTSGTCSSVWCHGNAAPVPFKGAAGTNRYRSPAWEITPCGQCHSLHGTPPMKIVTCSNCHAGAGTSAAMAGTDNLSAAHITHVASDRYRFTCDECHAWTVTNDGNDFLIVGTGYDNHVNGIKTVKFGATLRATTVNQSGGTYDNASLKCANTYCHSNGTSTTSFGLPNDNITWNSPTGSVCTTCHGGSGASSAPIATGSHAKHLFEGGYGCTVCHHGTVSDNVTISVYDNHVNGIPDVAFDPAAAVGTYTGAGKTCNVSCHGAVAQVWGGALVGGCLGCHSGTEQIYKPQFDYGAARTPNPVDNVEYLYSGHGRSGSGYPGSTNLPAGFSNYTTAPVDCFYCHSGNAPHTTKDPNDPFRLGYGTDTAGQKGTLKGAFADNTDLLCLGCHGTSAQRGSNPNAAQGITTVDALTHAREVTGTKYNWPNSPWKCVDCHDPHGDGKSGAERLMMIRSGINAPTVVTDNNPATGPGSDGKGRPKRTTDVSQITFTNVNGYAAGSYAQSGNGTGGTWGPCEVCHNQTTAFSRTKDNLASHATRTTRCSTCHSHKAGFAATCKGCHGPAGVDTTHAAPEVGRYWLSSGHGMTSPKNINVRCEACHDTDFVTAADHKVDGSAGAGPPPANINTQTWPGKTENANNQRNRNTAHLASSFFPAVFPGANPPNKYEYALAFDQKCSGPAAGCHPAAVHNNHPVVPGNPQPVDRVMRFGDFQNPPDVKALFWYPPISDYPTQFYASRGVWDIEDLTTNATSGYPGNAVRYGVCVSCHDPHGTNAPINRPGHATNVMLRGNSLSHPQFCGAGANGACHSSRNPP